MCQGPCITGHVVQTRRPGEEEEMPKLSKATAPHTEELGPLVGHYGELDDYTVGFEHFHADADATPLFKGLPGDRCQSPHWGYVIAGRVTFKYADHDEVYDVGDAYYAPPGHIPVVDAGTEVVEFSPTEEYAKTVAQVEANLAERA